MHKYRLMILLSACVALAAGPAFGLDITRHGITWTITGTPTSGTFVNGDPWVIGPVIITAINPAPTTIGDRAVNGSEVNPVVVGATQGYDGYLPRCKYTDQALYTPSYVSSRNVVANGLPITVQNGSSLISSESQTQCMRPQLKAAAVLTVLASAPAANSFRPGYAGTDKSIKFNKSDLDYSSLGHLTVTPPNPSQANPTLATTAGWFAKVWLDTMQEWTNDYQHPSDNMPNYPRDMCRQVSDAALLLNCDYTDGEKEALMINFVQYGIDAYTVLINEGSQNWINNGGCASGRYFPILFAGKVLNNSAMANIGQSLACDYCDWDGTGVYYNTASFCPSNRYWFGETDTTFYVRETAPGVYNNGFGGYGASDVGRAEWGERHMTKRNLDYKDDYRYCCTANTWAGQLLACLEMGITDLWNHNESFEYQDWFMAYQATQGEDYNRQISKFAENMWDEYRDNYEVTCDSAPTGIGFFSVPAAVSSSSITMQASSSPGAMYYFDCDADAFDKTWQYGSFYTPTGMTPNTQYGFRVKARCGTNDALVSPYSGWSYATTDAAQPSAHAMAKWLLDDNLATTAVIDSLGGAPGVLYDPGGVPGATTAAHSTTDGVVDRALTFDGVDDYVYVAADPNITFNGLESFTVSCWYQCNGNGAGGFGRIVDKYNTFWIIHKDTYLFVGLKDGSGIVQESMTTTGVVAFSTPTFLAATWNEDGDGKFKVYINGAGPVALATDKAALTLPSDSAYNLYIGNRQDGLRAFNGWIDNLQIYSSAWSAAEVLAEYNATKPADPNSPPDDATWASAPTTVDSHSITMQITAQDGCEYWFDCTNDNSFDSVAWQAGTTYTTNGMAQGTEYFFRCKARFTATQVESAWSTSLSATTDSPPPPPVVVAQWGLDDDAANDDVADNITPGDHCTLLDPNDNPGNTTAEHSTTGAVGKAFTFDGADDAILVDVSTYSGTPPMSTYGLTSCTWAGWFKADTAGEGNYGRILEKPNSCYIYTTSGGELGVRFYLSTTNAEYTTEAPVVLPGVTAHFAVVFNENLDSAVKIYINSVLMDVIQYTAGAGTFPDDTASDLYIGNRAAGDRTWDGWIDNLKFVDGAWTAEQVAVDYAEGDPLLTDPPGAPTWDTVPTAGNYNLINMSAVQDANYADLDFYFTCVTDANFSSGWRVGDNREIYQATGLTGAMEYCWTVKTRWKGNTTLESNASTEQCDTTIDSPATQCNDDIDNDGDHLVDYPDDRGCEDINDDDESEPTKYLIGCGNADPAAISAMLACIGVLRFCG